MKLPEIKLKLVYIKDLMGHMLRKTLRLPSALAETMTSEVIIVFL